MSPRIRFIAGKFVALHTIRTCYCRQSAALIQLFPKRRFVNVPRAVSGDTGDGGGGSELDEQRDQLARMMEGGNPITGKELRNLVFEKFNRSYDVRLQRRGSKMYVHIMWKFLEQRSFHLTEEEYELQLSAVAEYLNMWGAADTVRAGIQAAKRAPGYIVGGGAKAVSIPLGVDVGGAGRSDEWNSF